MNVLIMAKYATHKSGNFIASLLELSLRIRERGDNAYFLFPIDAQGRSEWISWLEENEFTVSFLDDNQDSEDIVHNLKMYIQQWDIKLIHCHFNFCLKELSLKISKFNGVKVLFHDHMDYSRDKNLPIQYVKQLLLSLLFRQNNIGVISVMEKKAKGYRICGKKRVWYVPNGLSLRRNVKRSMTREEMRKQLNILENEKLILFLGWDLYGKGADIALRAVEKLHSTYPNVVFGFLGLSKTPAKSKCDWIKEKTGIDPLNTSWLRFFEDCEDMFACHSAADIYISSSRREAFSYGLLETISQNVPVVISDVEGTLWALEYNKCLCYPMQDFSECANKLEQALDMRFEPSNSEELVSKYNIDSWCNEIINIYYKMIG